MRFIQELSVSHHVNGVVAWPLIGLIIKVRRDCQVNGHAESLAQVQKIIVNCLMLIFKRGKFRFLLEVYVCLFKFVKQSFSLFESLIARVRSCEDLDQFSAVVLPSAFQVFCLISQSRFQSSYESLPCFP